MVILEGAQPFLLPAGKTGVLLIHGFTGSPAEMRPLGEFLHSQGYTVLAPRLCGHGTSAAIMKTTRWSHWYDSVQDGYHLLSSMCDRIAVVGLSMGGLLAIKLASHYPAAQVVCLSTPIFLADKRLPMLHIVRMFRSFIPKSRRRRINTECLPTVAYDQIPLGSLSSLLRLIKHVAALLPELRAPLLIMQSRREHTVLPKSAQYIYDQAGSCQKQLIWLNRSGHIITLDTERYVVFDNIAKFFANKNLP